MNNFPAGTLDRISVTLTGILAEMRKPCRKVVEYTDGYDCGLVARCDDGTEWVRRNGNWVPNNPTNNPAIPQPLTP